VHLAAGDQSDEPTALRFDLPAVELKRAQRQVSWFQAADDRFGAVGITRPGKSGMAPLHPTSQFAPATMNAAFAAASGRWGAMHQRTDDCPKAPRAMARGLMTSGDPRLVAAMPRWIEPFLRQIGDALRASRPSPR
jgi:hypothetical protein